MKTVYVYDSKKLYIDQKQVDDSYQLSTNETFSAPAEGLEEPYQWSGSEWQSMPQPNWPYDEDAATDPTLEQQAITALAQQIANLTETNTQLEQAITALAMGGDK
ncbi:hypothetical protein [Lactiplantibacillus plantarum]|uniref:hypothetical protein n=1 Tax=Lactiplantibacillus plantarum TaxID=1590 RepID=UPI003F537A4F